MISTEVELNETLFEEVGKFIEAREGWTPDRVAQAALSLFLMHNGVNSRELNSLYLDSLFGRKV